MRSEVERLQRHISGSGFGEKWRSSGQWRESQTPPVHQEDDDQVLCSCVVCICVRECECVCVSVSVCASLRI
jgi:hypothetical protein